MSEFLNGKGLGVKLLRTVAQARLALAKDEYRLILVDMNIPDDATAGVQIRARTPLISRFPGLLIVIEARKSGYPGRALIAYTVHDDEGISAEMENLHCRYVLKGRPQVLKRVVEASLQPS